MRNIAVLKRGPTIKKEKEVYTKKHNQSDRLRIIWGFRRRMMDLNVLYRVLT